MHDKPKSALRAVIYIDTEFTSLSDPQLISIGAAAETGEEFYGVVSDYPRRACTKFVVENVIPLLEKRQATVTGNFKKVALEFRKWLVVLNWAVGHCKLIVDDECDAELLRRLLSGFNFGFESSSCETIVVAIHSDLKRKAAFEQYFAINPERYRHNALDDARALKAAFELADIHSIAT